MAAEQLVIAGRFCGPPRSGNGGYVCGRLAAHVPGVAVVRLKAPPPLETELRVEVADEVARLLHGADVIAEARSATLDLVAPVAPTFIEAAEAARSYLGFRVHAFPGCFVCGPQRAEADGLRIFAGPVTSAAASASPALVAAPWIPDRSLADGTGQVRREFLWSALDCPGAFAVLPVPEGKAVVLGELCARIDGSLAVGEACVVAGWPLRTEGRKHLVGTAIYDGAGRAVAVARATWLEVEASAFGGQ
jgi:hypothetical protein